MDAAMMMEDNYNEQQHLAPPNIAKQKSNLEK